MGLDTVELLMDVEEAFGIEISNEEASEIETVGEFYNVVLSKLIDRDKKVNKQHVWEKLCLCIVKIGGVDLEKIVPEARIVKDLGIH